jgi:phosphoglycerate dehydrogenase-like enzyme
MALMLGLCRELVAGHRGTSEAAYRELGTDPVVTSERKIAFNWLGFEDIRQLHGKILGLVGLGDIGLEVARRARAFDMEILYHKRSPLRATHEAAIGARYMTLEGLLAESDVVSLHAPHTPETEGMIDANTLARFKSSAILINTARGGLVDEAALVDALREGRLAGAGLDAFVEEPLPEGHALLDCPNVIFSPHVGGGTGGGQKGMIQAVVANLKRVEAGEAPHGLVEA